MHGLFADWYRIADPTDSSTLRQKRWAGVEDALNALNGADAATLLSVVRLVFNASPPDDNARTETISLLRDHFKSADDGFPMRENELLVRVLAGAAITTLIDNSPGTSRADIVAMAARCAVSAQHQSINPDLTAKAEDYLNKESVRVRDVSKTTEDVVISEELEQALELYQTAATSDGVGQVALGKYLAQLHSTLNDLAKSVNEKNAQI